MFRPLICIVFLCYSCLVFSQVEKDLIRCGSDDYLEDRLEKDEKFKAKFLEWTKKSNYVVDEKSKKSIACTGANSVVVPVAIHYNAPIDCSDPACLLQMANAQIQVLNEDYSATNADLSYYTSTLNGICPTAYPLSYAPTGGGSCISFCLATQNHPGVSGLADGEPAITVGTYTWPNTSNEWSGYLNIFVSSGTTAGLGGGTLGISALPGSADGDGFFVGHDYFGAPGVSCTSGAAMNTGAPYNLGRTATHEAGHYFGLYHTFQGGCGDGDANPPLPAGAPATTINDTPAQAADTGGCPNVTNCGSAPNSCGGQYTPFWSYMDYSNDACLVMFSEDQHNVMNLWGNALPWASNTTVCNAANNPTMASCPVPPCQNGVQDGNETGVDCGGPDCDPCPVMVSCDDTNSGAITFTDSGGTGGNYSNGESLTYQFCSTNGNPLTVTFSSFSTESATGTGVNGTGCWDYLSAYNGNNASAPLLGNYCGTTIPGPITSSNTDNCLYFTFSSDGSFTRPGWEALVTCGIIPTCSDNIMNGLETGVDCGGPDCPACPCTDCCQPNAVDSGGEAGGYSSNEISTWTYCPDDAGDMLSITFTYIDIETSGGGGSNGAGCWDYLEIFDGCDTNTTNSPSLGQYCGEESGDGGTPSNAASEISVGDVFTPSASNASGCLTFQFTSDGSVNETGWIAEIRCVPSNFSGADSCPSSNATGSSLAFSTSMDNTCAYQQSLSDISDFNLKSDDSYQNRSVCSANTPGGSNQMLYIIECDTDGVNGEDLSVDVTEDAGAALGGIDAALYGPVTGVCPNFTGGSFVACDDNSDGNVTVSTTVDDGEVYILVVNTENEGSFTVASTSASLPVELIDFSVKSKGQDAILSWSTASELNNEGFIIQRSKDGLSFEDIGFVKGNGTTTLQSDYIYQDKGLDSGTYYYKLSQSDFDGKLTESGIRTLQIESSEIKLRLFPNPSTGQMTIDGLTDDAQEYQVFDKLGRMVAKGLISLEKNQLDFSELKNGVYRLVTSSGEETSILHMVILK